MDNNESSFTVKEVELTKNKILKNRTMAYESLGSKLGLLREMSKYDKPDNFLENDQEELIAMDLEDYQNVINKYIQEKDFVYIIVGDKGTQWAEVEKFGKPVIELDVHGNLKQ